MNKLISLKILIFFLFIQIGIAQANISGQVFTDFNLNGIVDSTGSMQNFAKTLAINTAIDQGMSGITVEASCVTSSGSSHFSAVTDAQGKFSIATPNVVEGSHNCLLKLKGLPEGYSVGSQSSNNANVLTQFVSPNATEVQFAVKQAITYCQNNPDLATSRYAMGQQTPNAPFAGNNALTNLFGFPYHSGAKGAPGSAPTGYNTPLETDTAVKKLALVKQMGSVFGLGWHSPSKSIFAAAYMKAWTGFGPGGTGAIYRVRLDKTVPSTEIYADLNQIFPATPPTAGDDPYLSGVFSSADPGYVQIADGSQATQSSYIASGNSTRDNQDGQINNAVTKVGFGDLDVSLDKQAIFTINFANRELYILPIQDTALSAADASRIQHYPVPFADTCKADGVGHYDKLAFGLGEYQGAVYVGTRCDTGSSPLFELRRFDLAKQAFDTNPSMSYLATNDVYGVYNLPPADLVFDAQGNITLGLRIAVEMTGNSSYGALRRVCLQDAAQHLWVMENNGACGGVSTAGANQAGTGPGEGRYFFEEYPLDQSSTYARASYGGVAQIPGFLEAANTVGDPFRYYEAGVAWVDLGLGNSSTAGQRNRSYGFYQGRGYTDSTPLNGKNAALGDLEVLCDSAPVEMGNRVWQDSNNNGIQDAGEAPIAGVKVELFAEKVELDTATPLATALTDSQGYYLFSNDMRGYPSTGNNAPNDTTGANGGFDTTDMQGGRASSNSQKFGLSALQANNNYQIVIRNAEGASQQAPLHALKLSPAKQGADAERDSDANLLSNNAISQVTTISESNNHALDFGFNTPIPIDLELSKSVSQPAIVLGETFSYSLTLTNKSEVTATAIQIKDALPSGLSLVKATPVLGTFTNGLWEIPSLAANQTTSLTLDVVLNHKPEPLPVP